MVDIVGFMRFSVVTIGQKGFKATRERDLDDAVATVLSEERLSNRIRLFEEIPLKSLDNQTDKNFQFVILISSLLPQQYKQKLGDLCQDRPYITIEEIGPTGRIRPTCEKFLEAGKPMVSFRLDDDDGLNRLYIEDLRSMSTADNLNKVLSFPNGFYLTTRNNRVLLQDIVYPSNAFGIAYFSDSGKSIFHLGSHSKLHRRPIAYHERRKAWIRTIHAGSDSGAKLHRGRPWGVFDPRMAGDLMPEYETFDFGKIIKLIQ